MSKSRRNRSLAVVPAVATATAAVVAKSSPVTANEYAHGVAVRLARDSFAAISNPRRRRLRKGDGGYHCDYRTVEELRNISRWLEYNSATYAGALHNWSQHLVGEGPVWVPKTKDTDWNRRAAELLAGDFAAKRHDIRGRHTWGRWIKLLAVSIVRDGSMGIAHTVNGPAQLIEAERVVAVDTDRQGRVTQYMVAQVKNGWLDYGSKEPISPAMMDFPAVITRISQDLGVPLCFSSLDDHDGIADLWQAEIDSAAESVRPWMILSHKDGNGLPGGQTIPGLLTAGNNSGANQGPNNGRPATPEGWMKTPNGNVMGLPPGLEGTPHQPDRPNLDVPEFTKQVMRVACMMLLPYELLFGDQADISYSNGRSIRKLANGLLNCFRSDYLNESLARIARSFLRGHMANDRLGVPKDPDAKAWMNGDWTWDEIPEHDRIKEREADTIDLNNGTATLKDLVGEEWQAKMEQTAIESVKRSVLAAKNLQEIQQLCNELNAQTPGLDIKWSHLVTIAGAASAPGAYLQAATGAVAVEKQSEDPAADDPAPAMKSKVEPAAVPV
ncbi:MAG TPA: phage portal protein [Planctomycetota bacterium]|jgi:hypothetical protein|nr:phage portal protein [Planctomycetota bacterium]